MLAALRHIACEVGRASLQDLDTKPFGAGFTGLADLKLLVLHAECLPVVRVRTALQHALVAIGAALPPIRVDVVAEIPREAGPGAKLKTVVVRPR